MKIQHAKEKVDKNLVELYQQVKEKINKEGVVELYQQAREKLNNGAKELLHYVKIHRKKAISSLAIVTMLAIGSLIGNHIYQSNLVDVYHVFLHGEEIGTVSSPAVIENWLTTKETIASEQYAGFNLQFDKDISYKHEKIFKGSYDNDQTLAALASSIEVKAKAFKLVVDGELIGYVKSEAEGKRILDSIKSKYVQGLVTLEDKKKSVGVAALREGENVNKSSQSSEELVDVSINEKVEFVPTVIDPEEMSAYEEIEKLLSTGAVEEKIYTIQEGDCLGCVAAKFGLKIADLKRLNPGLDENTVLQIGQQINVTALDPKLTVKTVTKKTQVEEIPYKTKYIEDKSMYKGQQKVKQKGAPGEKEVTYHITRENGVVIGRKAVDEEVISEPKMQIIIKGTKPVPTVRTGKFLWPTKGGYITSPYGKRWGRMHKGIDISGVKDKTVMAADNGKVIFAGWRSLYGNTVIIDHGDGYETLYAHLSKISVDKGDRVAKGQKIGVMGSTGRSTGVHLHFEIIKNGKNINPRSAY